MPILLVGATGVLRPAAMSLAASGSPVVAMARSGTDLAEMAATNPFITALPADASDVRHLAEALGERMFDGAVVYAPAVGPDTLPTLRVAVAGRLVLVLTSACADTSADDFGVEDLGPPKVSETRLLLGWNGFGGTSRWHTPDEISAAALAVFTDGRERILGSVRPWRDRPSD